MTLLIMITEDFILKSLKNYADFSMKTFSNIDDDDEINCQS